MVTLTDLRERTEILSPTAVRFVARTVESLSSPPMVTVREPDTWITGTPDRCGAGPAAAELRERVDASEHSPRWQDGDGQRFPLTENS